MGRFCILCSRITPNEAFGGKGERARVCRKCRRMPREKRDAQLREREILGFLEQSHISPKNLARLRALRRPENPRIADLACVVLEVGASALPPPANSHSGAGTSRCSEANGGSRADHAAASIGGYGPVRHRPGGRLVRMGRIRAKLRRRMTVINHESCRPTPSRLADCTTRETLLDGARDHGRQHNSRLTIRSAN